MHLSFIIYISLVWTSHIPWMHILVWKKKKQNQNRTGLKPEYQTTETFLGCIICSTVAVQAPHIPKLREFTDHTGDAGSRSPSSFVPTNGRLLITLTFPSGTVVKMHRWKACLGMWIRMSANSPLPLSDLIVHICIPPLGMPKQWPVHPLLTSQMLKTKQTTALPNMVKLSSQVEQHLEKEWGDLKEILKDVCGEWVF